MEIDPEPSTFAATADLSISSSKSASLKTMIHSCMIGNALEWYDFVIYGYFAAIFGTLFFPNADELSQILASWAVFWAGFLARPIGSIIYGHIGDITGRKRAIILSLFMMAIPTALIGFLPTYDQVGILAPICLVILRTLQGLALGGEFTGSLIFVIEHGGNKGGKFGSWVAASAVIGIIIGSTLVATLNIFLDPDEMQDWGWRIPFVISIFGSMVGIYMRTRLRDPETYLEAKAKNLIHSTPLKAIFNMHKRELGLIFLFDFLTAIGFFLITIFLVNYLTQYMHLPTHVTFIINTINMCIFAAAIFAGGSFADRYSHKIVAGLPCLGFILISYPLFKFFQSHSVFVIFLTQAIFATMFGIFFGVLPAILVKIMPTHIRYTGLSLGHNLSMAVFGGSAPLIATKLIASTGNVAAPAFMLITAGILSLSALYYIRERPV